jgi:hypothetical protein
MGLEKHLTVRENIVLAQPSAVYARARPLVCLQHVIYAYTASSPFLALNPAVAHGHFIASATVP